MAPNIQKMLGHLAKAITQLRLRLREIDQLFGATCAPVAPTAERCLDAISPEGIP
jgi:hypothetical protein